VHVFVDMFRMRNQLLTLAAEREELARTEARRAAAEQAKQRADFLARASKALTRSLEVEATVSRVVELAVPRLADIALVVFPRGLGIVPEAAACIAPSVCGGVVDPTTAVVRMQIVVLPAVEQAVRDAISGGQPVTLPVRDVPLLASIGGDGERCDLVLDVDEITAYPLLTDEPQPSAIVLGVRRSAERIDDATLTDEFVGRAGIALENALLFSTIRDRDRRKNEFLAMLAHELRNPLAPIVNAVAVMRDATGGDAQVMRWASEMIGTQAEHLVRIVDDLLDVSRIARGVVTLRTESVLLSTVIERAVATSGPNFTMRSQTLDVEPSEIDAVIDGDIVRLSQIIANLLNNASKFSPSGGHVKVRTRFDGTTASIVVSDEGDGIDPAFVPHMFDLFAQGETSLDRTQGGLGIGLTLARHLTEMHRGTIHCESEGRGKGSRFTVRLPARIVPRAEGEHMTFAPKQPTAGVRILIVDDMLQSAESLEAFLRICGHQVQCSSDGPSALAQARTFLPDVVLLDIGLPGMTGFEVAQHMRADELLRRSLIIAISGYGEEDHRRRAEKVGIDRYLVKPADLNTLLGIIEGYSHSRAAAQPPEEEPGLSRQS